MGFARDGQSCPICSGYPIECSAQAHRAAPLGMATVCTMQPCYQGGPALCRVWKIVCGVNRARKHGSKPLHAICMTTLPYSNRMNPIRLTSFLPWSALVSLLAALFLSGCGKPPYQDVDAAQLRELIAQGVPIYDIRRPEEWRQTGVVAGSRLLTWVDASGRPRAGFHSWKSTATPACTTSPMALPAGSRAATLWSGPDHNRAAPSPARRRGALRPEALMQTSAMARCRDTAYRQLSVRARRPIPTCLFRFCTACL